MKEVTTPSEFIRVNGLHRPKPRLRMFIGISSALPLPFGSSFLKASSTFSSSSQVVGILSPSLSSQVLLMNMWVPETS